MARLKNLIEKAEDVGTVTIATDSDVIDATAGQILSVQAIVSNSSGLGSATLVVSGSNDQENWISADSKSISGNGSVGSSLIGLPYRFYKATLDPDGGSMDVVLDWLMKGIDG